MQHELETENMVMMNNPDMRPLTQVTNPQLERYRTILLIMLGICLGFWLAIAFVEIVDYTVDLQTNTRIVGSIAAIAFYAFGLFVSCKYSKKGLRMVCNLI
ncbi:unnamed protein product [Adineta steineri]|uniref:Uncharacterized protein n=1 Tax=Adineta steineri TaxID=433720 RepID=A0A814NVQ3_9BILA|nr:unnamed protein product [Adineta steineri]